MAGIHAISELDVAHVTILRGVEVFRALTESMFHTVLGDMEPLHIAAGVALFEEGEHGDAAYVLIKGRIALEASGVTVLIREPGDFVGEFALIDDEPRSATARALTEAMVFRWARFHFRRSLWRSPVIADGLFRMLTHKLREDVHVRVRAELERARWQQDLSRAREIQMGMLPQADMELPRLEAVGLSRPADAVGGDFYDWLALAPDRAGLLIADVTGHGFYSSLLVAMTKSSLHARAHDGDAPDQIVAMLRRTQELSLHRRLLMSCCYVLFEPRQARLRFANAGHPPPCVWRTRDASISWLEPIDPLLGALSVESSTFECRTRPWEPGDVLVAYTDGVTESRDASGSQFGAERLEACVRSHALEGPGPLLEAILAALNDHGDGGSQADDLTVLVARAI